MLQKILERTNIQALREFLLYGMENEGEVSQSYSDRLKNAYKKQEDIVAEYDERGEESDLHKAIDNILFDYENVYMELGIRAGFLLAKDMYIPVMECENRGNTYKKMYSVLFKEITDALETLQNAQRKTEEIYLKYSEDDNS